jgi:hypothetical protein
MLNKESVIAVLAVLWLLGFGMAAAFTYDMTRDMAVQAHH